MFTPVITSKAAQDHMDMIKAEHMDIVKGMQLQAQRVANFNTAQDVMAREKATNDREANQNNVVNMQKQQEIELKRLALTQP